MIVSADYITHVFNILYLRGHVDVSHMCSVDSSLYVRDHDEVFHLSYIDIVTILFVLYKF